MQCILFFKIHTLQKKKNLVHSVPDYLFCHFKIPYRKDPPFGEKTQESEPVDGIVALQKTFQKIPLKKMQA